MANGRLFGATRCLGVSARLSPHMLRRPLEVQDRAWARKKRGTRVLGLYFWSQAVIARGGPKHSPHLGDVNTYSVILFRMSALQREEFRDANGSPGTL